MNYILKQYNTDLMKFRMDNTNNGLEVEIHWIDENKEYLLPLDLEQTNESLIKWLKGRTIPRNRAYVSNFLSRMGLNEKDTKGIIDVCQGQKDSPIVAWNRTQNFMRGRLQKLWD